jgi:hypothetical protein
VQELLEASGAVDQRWAGVAGGIMEEDFGGGEFELVGSLLRAQWLLPPWMCAATFHVDFLLELFRHMFTVPGHRVWPSGKL